MKFLAGDELTKAVRRITGGDDVRCAVAFWGSGADALFTDIRQQKLRLVCNLRAGGTNPRVIESLCRAGAELRQCDDLHAKVYLSERGSVVASANASANGLGLEGLEQAGWREAGVSFSDTGIVEIWFERLWSEGRAIRPEDIEAAKIAWDERRKGRPSLSSFERFDPAAAPVPMIAWYWDAESAIVEENVREQVGYFDEALEKAILNGVTIEGPEDEPVLKSGRWILWWERTKAGRLGKRHALFWSLTGHLVLRKARRDGGLDAQDVVLAAEGTRPEPFDLNDLRFVEAFRTVITEAKYEDLRTGDYEGAWFAPRQELMSECWRDIKRRFLEYADTSPREANRSRDAAAPRAADR